ncbi:MAG: hypothetical protein HY816_20050 [Candidatus Wallbacteria bacterium]|nr:hypothetical protein [Candidatus Wallbacteria bacterium]
MTPRISLVLPVVSHLRSISAQDIRTGRNVTLLCSLSLSKAHPIAQQIGPPSRGQSPDTRWITVHPNGPDEPGQPVMLRLASDGSHYRIVGGAGGSLAHLKIDASKLKSPEESRQEAKEKKREDAKQEKERQSNLTPDERRAEEMSKKERSLHRRIAERKFVEHMRQKFGGVREDIPEEKLKHLTEQQQGVLIALHHKKQLSEAKGLLKDAKRELVRNLGQRTQEELGQLPVHGDADEVGLSDFQKQRTKPRESAKGYRPEDTDEAIAQVKKEVAAIDEREEERRLDSALAAGPDLATRDTELDLHSARLEAARAMKQGDEKGAVKHMVRAERLERRLDRLSEMEPEQQIASERFREMTKKMWSGIREARAGGISDTTATPMQERQAVEILEALKAEKGMKRVVGGIERADQMAKKAGGDWKAFVPEEDTVTDEQVIRDLVEEERAKIHKSFLSTIEDKELGGGTAAYYASGGYDGINEMALAIGLQPVIDRETLDTFGIKGAAELLAHRLHQDHGDQVKAIKKAVSAYHVETAAKKAEAAMAEAEKHMDEARQLHVQQADSPADLEAAAEIGMQAEQSLEEARRHLGTALGQMEAVASLNFALGRRPVDEVVAQFDGDAPAILKAKALGLEQGTDYKVDRADGGGYALRVFGPGLDKLVKKFEPEEYHRTQKALDILAGKHDEDGWLPAGIVSRPALHSMSPPGTPEWYEHPLEIGASDDVRAKTEAYVGARLADGHRPRDIYADLLNSEFRASTIHPSHHEAFDRAVTELFPSHETVKGNDGDLRSVPVPLERFEEHFRQLGQEWADTRFGNAGGSFHSQAVDLDAPDTLESTYRALAKEPRAKAAFTAPADLDHDGRRALRDFFYSDIAKIDPKVGRDDKDVQRRLKELGPEPDREVPGLFGTTENPEWSRWSAEKARIQEEAATAPTAWQEYVQLHRGEQGAYESLQDELKGRFLGHFHEAHGKLTGKELKVGKTGVRNEERHLAFLQTPEERAAVLRGERSMLSAVRHREGGRYSKGSVKDRLDRALADETVMSQHQMTMFAAEPVRVQPGRRPELDRGERLSLGQTVEGQLARIVPEIGRNFDPRKPVDLRAGLSMSKTTHGDFRDQQRAVKLLDAQGKIGVHKGVGSGKSLISIAGFTHLHSQGKVKRGLLAVPSAVQQQFGSEMLRFTDPRKGYHFFADGKANKDERMAAYRDASGNHLVVVTHQALRDDVLDMVGNYLDHITREKALSELEAVTPRRRANIVKSALKAHGINWQYMGIDESQYVSGRAGKEESGMQTVLDALFHPAATPYGMLMSGTPVKNDPSEGWDLLRKLSPDRYPDREDFMRRYGVNTPGSAAALQREMAPRTIAGRIPPVGVTATYHKYALKLSPWQQAEYQKVKEHFKAAQRAREDGKVNVDAVRALSPSSFESVPAEQHEALAQRLSRSLGILKTQAYSRVVNAAPAEHSAKLQHLLEAIPKHVAAGRPTVIFASRYASLDALKGALEAKGIPVGVVSGRMNGAEKARQIGRFQPESGKAEVSVLILTDAGQTGINLQRGKELYHFDLPETAASWEQRNGRIFRTGQTGDVGIHDLTTDTPYEAKKSERIRRKQEIGKVFQDSASHLDDSGIAAYLHREGVKLFQNREVTPSQKESLAA